MNGARNEMDDGSFSSYDSESSLSSSSSSSFSDRLDAEQGYTRAHAHEPSRFRGKGNAAVRRRNAPTSGNRSASEAESDPDDGYPSNRRRNNNYSGNDSTGNAQRRHRHHHKRRKPRSSRRSSCVSETAKSCRKNHPTIVKHIPSIFLGCCVLFWLAVQTSNVFESVSQSTHREPGSVGQRNARLAARNKHDKNQNKATPPPPPPRPARGSFAFLSDAVEGIMDVVGLPAKLFQKASRGEALPAGCVRSPWQELNLQNCNDIHEVDLYETFTGRAGGNGGGYVGSGYWRHVWLVDPRNQYHDHANTKAGAVLKMMMSYHKVEPRNFERHRRDALAMERLTASKHIVDIYSYCGNSVLTEYVGSDMHMVLYHPDDDATTVTKQQRGPRTDRETLQLALDVVQGVADLHQVPGGPIVHADIADKQFLIDDQGLVKLNDFNRCRFMGHKKGTKEKCTFRIPSAPGRNRSPEEYDDTELTEQLDTYSTANVLYGILTGAAPWGDDPSSLVKRHAKRGEKPPIDDKLRLPGSAPAVLASLIDKAYERDPEKRISAPALAKELRKALDEL